MRKSQTRLVIRGVQNRISPRLSHNVVFTHLAAVLKQLGYAQFVRRFYAALLAVSMTEFNLLFAGLCTQSTGLITEATSLKNKYVMETL